MKNVDIDLTSYDYTSILFKRSKLFKHQWCCITYFRAECSKECFALYFFFVWKCPAAGMNSFEQIILNSLKKCSFHSNHGYHLHSKNSAVCKANNQGKKVQTSKLFHKRTQKFTFKCFNHSDTRRTISLV